MGLFQDTQLHDPAAMRRQAGILDKYDRWWAESLGILRQYGYIHIGDGCATLAEHAEAEAQRQVWEEWRARKQYFLSQPEIRTLAVLVEEDRKSTRLNSSH